MSKRDVVDLGTAHSAIGTFGGAQADTEPAERAAIVARSKGLTLAEDNAGIQTTEPLVLPQAMSESYPPQFDQEFMRWMPLVVPLMGFFTALITGVMWTLVG